MTGCSHETLPKKECFGLFFFFVCCNNVCRCWQHVVAPKVLTRITTSNLFLSGCRRWAWSNTAMPLAWRYRWGNIREKMTSSEPSRASATWEETHRQDSVHSLIHRFHLFLKRKFNRFSSLLQITAQPDIWSVSGKENVDAKPPSSVFFLRS